MRRRRRSRGLPRRSRGRAAGGPPGLVLGEDRPTASAFIRSACSSSRSVPRVSEVQAGRDDDHRDHHPDDGNHERVDHESGPFRDTRGVRLAPEKRGCSHRANGRDVRYDDDLHPTDDLRIASRPEGPDRWHATTCWRSTRGRPAPAPSSTTASCGRSGRGRPRSRRPIRNPGWVEHDPAALVASVGPLGGPGPGRSGDRGGSDRGHRPDQPARDDGPLGPPDRPGDRPGPGLAGPPDRRRSASGIATDAPGSPSGPAWCSTPTSRPPRSPGCSTTSPTPAAAPRPASWPPGPSTACSSGT